MSTLAGKHCRLYRTKVLDSEFISKESKKAFDSISSVIPDGEYMLTSAVSLDIWTCRSVLKLRQNHIIFSARDYYRVPSDRLAFMSRRNILSLNFKFFSVLRVYDDSIVLFEFRPIRMADYNEGNVVPL